MKVIINPDQRIDSVILLGRWSDYGRGTGIGNDLSNTIKVWRQGEEFDASLDQYELFMREFKNTVMAIRQADLKVFVTKQPPEFPDFDARTFAMDLVVGRKDNAKNISAITTVPVSELDHRQGPMQNLLREMEEAGHIEMLRTHQFLCGEEQCSLVSGGVPLYRDTNHLASDLVPKINQIFQPYADFQATIRESRALKKGNPGEAK